MAEVPSGGGSRQLAVEISRCEVLTATLRGEPTPCREVVGWHGLSCDGPRYVPEPWVGHLAEASILFVSSNPSTGERGQALNPAHRGDSTCTDEELFLASDHAFDEGPWPGVADAIYCRDKDGQRIGRWVSYWAWNRRIARELLQREPAPGHDYALTEVVHCGSRGEYGVNDALPECARRYLRRVVRASAASVIVLAGSKAKQGFQSEVGIRLIDGFYGPTEVEGRSRCVIALPHPNARGPLKGAAANLGEPTIEIVRSSLRTSAASPLT